MPNSEAIFATLTKDHVFSKLDCSKGYWYIAMHANNIENTTSSSPSGLFQFRRMPLGLVNARASYGCMMRKLLNEQMWPEHLAVLRKVFKRLISPGITVKPSKCFLGYSKIDFVGHQVGEGQLMTQDDKVERVQEASVPQTVTQVRSFLGPTIYYRKLIQNYVSIWYPFNKPTKVVWSENADRAFKAMMCCTPTERSKS